MNENDVNEHEKKPLRRGAKKGACLKKEVCSLQKYHRLE